MVQTHTQYMEHRPRAALTVGVFILLISTAPCALVDLHILYISEGGDKGVVSLTPALF